MVTACVQVGLAVAEAVCFMHEQGLLHRDLKADNILFTSLGVPKVCDFGLAQELHKDAHNEV